MGARLALIGGEEFADGFEDVHAGLLAGLGRDRPRVAYLPTCAADDGAEVVDYWCAAARERLAALGADVETPRVVDRASADDAAHAQSVAAADCVYIGGGIPHVGMRILTGTRVLAALRAALARADVLVAGASAGAMLLCARSFVITPELSAAVERALQGGTVEVEMPLPQPLECLGVIPRSLCMPHFNRIGAFGWAARWFEQGFLPADHTAVGVDEQTALVSDGDGWVVRGHGVVALLRNGSAPVRYGADEVVDWSMD